MPPHNSRTKSLFSTDYVTSQDMFMTSFLRLSPSVQKSHLLSNVTSTALMVLWTVVKQRSLTDDRSRHFRVLFLPFIVEQGMKSTPLQ